MAVVELIFDVKSPAWVTGNTNVPKNGEPIFLNNGSFAFGDGVTQVQALTFFSPSSGAWGSITGTLSSQTDLQTALNGKQNTITTGTTAQYFRGDLSLATFPTNVSSFTNDSGYITSSALSPYLTIANAALTYQPIGSYLTGLTVGSTAIGSGTNTRILYNNAGVLGEYAVTGTGTTAVLSNSPTFLNKITTPAVEVTGNISAPSWTTFGVQNRVTPSTITNTTSSGTISNSYTNVYGGNTIASGSATTYTNYFATYFKDDIAGSGSTFTNRYSAGFEGLIQVGISAGTNSGRQVEIFQDSANVKIGSLVGATSQPAIYLNQATPSLGNYSIRGDGSNTIINSISGASTYIGSGNGNQYIFGQSALTFTPSAVASGNLPTFQFTKPNNTGQTASTNIPGFLFTTGSRQWATGAISLQEEIRITAPTYSFVGASTITNAYTLFVNSPTAGTNATITNNYAIGTNGDVSLTGGNRVLRSSGGNLRLDCASGSVVRLDVSGTASLTASSTQITLKDQIDFVFGTTTGTKFGTGTTQKLAFWNATPIVQPTTAVAAATFVANTSGIANDTATFDGYTIGQVVKALRDAGLLA